MYKKILAVMVFSFLSGITNAQYHFSDYTNIRDQFQKEKSQFGKILDKENARYRRALRAYQSCSSEKWRVVFATVVPKIEDRISTLGKYKKNALTRSGSLNSEWLKTAQEHKISQVRPNTDVSDFYFWYQGHISLQKQGPLHELELYTIALSKLSEVYEKMDSACSGNTEAALDYDLFEHGITGLLDEVFSLIGKII